MLVRDDEGGVGHSLWLIRLEPGLTSSAGRVPDARRAVLAGGCHARAVRAERRAGDLLGVPTQLAQCAVLVRAPVSARIPDACTLVLARRNRIRPILTECGAVHLAGVTTQL